MTDDVLIAPGTWSPTFCVEVRQAMDRGEAEAAEIVDSAILVDTVVRRAFDVTPEAEWLDRIEHALESLRPRLSSFFGVELTGSVGATCLRYPEGGLYRRHRDRDNRRGSGTEMRRVSMIMWLNSSSTTTDRGEFDGGLLRLYADTGGSIDIVPSTGTLVAFPSEWPHEVLPVTRGTRDAVVDWLY